MFNFPQSIKIRLLRSQQTETNFRVEMADGSLRSGISAVSSVAVTVSTHAEFHVAVRKKQTPP